MAIKPIDLPSAAGVEFGLGDVRHFSEDDAVAVPALQNPTRHLAQRDNLLAQKVNEVVSAVNNKEQFVPLPMVRTSVSPTAEEIVTNFRIPVGFEARVLNASVASSPSSSDLALKIFYNASFGGSTGTELVSTSDEFTAGTAFYNNGEFIVSIRNNGASSLEALSSVTLTIRPIAERGSLLVGSVITGGKGNRGEAGSPGKKGDPGPGAPSVAIVWKSNYSAAADYAPGDAVYYATTASSYLCKVTNGFMSVVKAPTDTTYWDLLVAGTSGAAGTGFTFKGNFTSVTWVASTAWLVNDYVTYTAGGATSTYICYTAATMGSANPPAATGVWTLAASGATGSGETPTYAKTVCTGVGGATPSGPYVNFGGTYVQGTDNSGYAAFVPGANRNDALAFTEYKVTNTSGAPKGIAILSYQNRLTFKGDVRIYLPKTTSGAALNYSTDDIGCQVVVESNGTHGLATNVDFTGTSACYVTPRAVVPGLNDYYHIDVATVEPRNVSIYLHGIVPIM